MIVTDIVNFTLADLTVPVGTTVLWTQLDAASHTTTSGTPGDTTGLWDSGTLSRNQTFTHTFTEEGSFPYFCRIHPGSMQATVEVVADTEGSNTTDVPEPPAASTPTPGATTPPVPTPTSPTLTPAPTPTPQTPPTRTGEPALTPTPTSPPAAESVTLPSSKDNTLYEDAGGALSNGGGDFFFAGKNGQGATRRGVIAFDVAAAVPGGSIVTSASLILNMSRTSGGGGSVSLHRLLADWGEGNSNAGGNEGRGGPASPGDATWIHSSFDSEVWATPGGDFKTEASAATNVSGIGGYTWESTLDLVGDVQAWLDDPGTNFGWLIMGNESRTTTAKRFDSRENSDEATQPVLMVEFIPG